MGALQREAHESCTLVSSLSTSIFIQVIGVVQRLGGGRGCRKFVPVLGGDGTKIAPPGDIFDQPPGEMS